MASGEDDSRVVLHEGGVEPEIERAILVVLRHVLQREKRSCRVDRLGAGNHFVRGVEDDLHVAFQTR